MALRRISDIIENGTTKELISARRMLKGYKQKLINQPYSKDTLLEVEEDIRLINIKLEDK